MDLDDLLFYLDDLGLSDIILPFLFVFLITYGVLSNLMLFKKVKSIDAVLAIVFATYATLYAPFSDFLIEFIATSMIIMVLIFMTIIVVGSYLMFSRGKNSRSHLRFAVWKHAGSVTIVLLIAIFLFFRNSLKNSGITYLDTVVDIIPGILVLLGVYWFIVWLVGGSSGDYRRIIKEIDKEAEEELLRTKYELESIPLFGNQAQNEALMKQKIAVRKLNSGELTRKLSPDDISKLLEYYGVEKTVLDNYLKND